ncbi:MAG: glycosyltransferase family 4 protein, partial [Proteobacteria bacterium]
MKVALVHDWLTGLRGGERCLQALLGIFPEADIFTLVHIPGSTSKEIDARVKGCSFLNSNFLSRRLYRMCLPLFPAAAGKLRIAGYDLVISLSHAAAKNAAIDRNSTHLCYCFTPMRYIWDQARIYLGSMLLPLWPLIRSLRSWDVRGSRSVTEFIAISSFVAAR